MKIVKSDGTIEEGIGITDAQAAEMQHIEETLHIVLCQHSYHYEWQGMPKCKKVAQSVALGGSWVEAMEGLLPRPVPESEPESAPELDPTPVSQIETSPISETTSQPTPESLPASTVPGKDDIPF